MPKIKWSWSVFHKSMQQAGTVKRALRGNPEYQDWYKKNYGKKK